MGVGGCGWVWVGVGGCGWVWVGVGVDPELTREHEQNGRVGDQSTLVCLKIWVP